KKMSVLLLGLLISLPFFLTSAQDELPVEFMPYDVLIDTGEQSLTAWQIELRYDRKQVAIVGLEGGDLPTGRPPHYDSRGLQAGRIIIADFTTEKGDLPEGRFRLARLHLQVTGDLVPEFDLKLLAAAQPGGERIPATLSIEKMQEEE
ncbi:MAG: hypothetical protein AAF492_17845, partial [Verrucomicrobiota bacterium]